MKIVQSYAGICMVFALIFEVTGANLQSDDTSHIPTTKTPLEKEHKGVISCGHIFDKSVGSITNNTLHPSSVCAYHINPPADDTKGTYIILKRLLLDENDNVTISELNKTDAIFPVFHGQSDAVPLISNIRALTITIETSSASDIVRHFDASYDSTAETCSFVIDDFVLTIQQPLTVNKIPAECTFNYNARSNIARSFSFQLFNLSASSFVSVTGVENPVSSFIGDNRPPDLFSHVHTKFDLKTNPGDHLVLQQFLLNSACSGYFNVADTAVEIETPARPPLDNGSLNLECRWFFESHNNNLGFTIKSINLDSVYDIVVITDGPHYDSQPVHQIMSSIASQFIGKEILTNSTMMVVSFKPVSLLSKFTASVRDLQSDDTSDVPTIEKGHKGIIECGHVFDTPTGSVENNTLHPNTTCSYIINPKNESQPVRMLLKKLLLDSKDNITITEVNETELLFPVFYGQMEAVPLLTNVKTVNITIRTSTTANITRHFKASYDAIATECILKVDNDIPTVQQPLATNNETAKCKLMYLGEANVEKSFSFETFNLSDAESSIGVSEVENPGTFTGKIRPPDLFAKQQQQATFDVSIEHGDAFVLRLYELNAACSSYIKVTGSNIVKTPAFPKIDNGSLHLECRWLFENPNNALGLTLKTVEFHNPYDILLITDGPNFDSSPLLEITSLTAAHALDSVIRTNGKSMIVSLKLSSVLSKFEADIFDAGQGKYFKNNGTLVMTPSKGDDTWLLQSDANETAVLTFHQSSFSKPAIVDIYDDFSLNSSRIASLEGNVWYPILSTTPRMMVVTKDFDKGQFEADFSGSVTGCMRMSQGSSDSYTLSKNCNSKCAWIIPPIDSNNTDLLLDMQFIALEDGDSIEVLQLDDKKTSLAKITSGMTRIPQLMIKSEVGAYVNVSRGPCPKRPNDIILVAQANYMPECSGNVTLTPLKTVTLTSPGFPNTYPLLSDCKWSLTTSPVKQLMHLTFDKLQLAPNHCVVITENGSKPLQYSGSVLPNDLFFTTDAMVEFNSNNCDPKEKSSLTSDQGFVLNATSANCGKIFTDSTGEFTTVANKTVCIYQIIVPATENDNVNIIIFTVKPKDKTGNYKLDIYDGASTRDDQIMNTTESEMWSRTNTLIIIYRPENISKPATEVTISYKTKSCDKTMQCNNTICLHPDWRCNGVNDCGDFSDEINCEYVPTPTPTSKPPPPGVSSSTFGITVFFMFLLGAGVAIITPFIYKKVLNRQYSQFRDVSVIE